MKKLGINLQVHYIPVHTQPFYKNKYGFEFGDFPVSENFYDRVVSIPLYPSLTDAEVEKVVADISSFVESK
jgi:dTDP-4-amino-4,6-dideoxygalactose transaminase